MTDSRQREERSFSRRNLSLVLYDQPRAGIEELLGSPRQPDRSCQLQPARRFFKNRLWRWEFLDNLKVHASCVFGTCAV
jgi:hypothetical protein